MEVNKPDRGIFKGVGSLQKHMHINRKYFPKVRNIHHFEYTHEHPNNYLTSFNHFHKHKETPPYEKVKKYTNESTVVFGTDKNRVYTSLAKDNYRRWDSKPPSLIRHEEEGIGLGETKLGKFDIGLHYKTTAVEKFENFTVFPNDRKMVSYKDTRTMRFNPITGEQKTMNSFGFEDFSMNSVGKYKANNFSHIGRGGQKYDIISGRKLTQQ